MKKQDWAAKIAESSRARIMTFAFFILLIGGFTFLALHARANLAASHAVQTTLSQQTQDIRAAGSMNDFYSQSWLANDQNLIDLAGYVRKIVNLPIHQPLDPKFKQELNDYIQKNRPQLPKEAIQIEGLSFSEGILSEDQSRLLDMYDELSLVFQTMQDIVLYWDLDMPQDREEKIFIIQDGLYSAGVEFQATRSNHQKILKYARQLDVQSKQANGIELGRIRTSHTQFTLSIIGLSVSVLLFTCWGIFLACQRRKKRKEGIGDQ